MLLNPEINANTLNWAQNADKARTPANDSVGKGSSLVRGVEPRGLEPLTLCLQSRCATNCAMAPGRPGGRTDGRWYGTAVPRTNAKPGAPGAGTPLMLPELGPRFSGSRSTGRISGA